MFSVKLYRFYCEKNKIDKTKYMQLITTLYGNLREATSITNISIIVSLDIDLLKNIKADVLYDDNGSLVAVNDVIVKYDNEFGFNYLYIDEFKRYYFINDLIAVEGNLWQIDASCDVLMSFKENIYNINAFITRNEFEYNNLIVDDLLTYEYDKEVNEVILPLGDKVDTFMQPYNNPSIIDSNYTISVINTSMNNSISPEVVNSNNNVLNNVGIYNVGASLSSETYATYYTMINRLYRALINNKIGNVDLDSYVLSCICYPFTIKAGTEASKLKLGNTELTDVDVYDLNKKLSEYYTIADFTITADDNFLSYNPYTIYELYIPFMNWIQLDANAILNNRILVEYIVNYQTGSAEVVVIDDTNNKLLYANTCQLGVNIPINSTNSLELEKNRLSNNLSLILGTASSVGMMATGHVLGGAMGLAGTGLNYFNNYNKQIEQASGHVADSYAGVYMPTQCRLRTTKLKPKNLNDDKYKALYGKPLNAVRRIGNLKGFTIASDFHLENIASATTNEINLIDSILKNGFII